MQRKFFWDASNHMLHWITWYPHRPVYMPREEILTIKKFGPVTSDWLLLEDMKIQKKKRKKISLYCATCKILQYIQVNGLYCKLLIYMLHLLVQVLLCIGVLRY